MEIINRLLNYKDLNIVQNTDWFNFSLDSVLLSNFVSINKTTKNIMDFCTGNAPIPLILSTKTNSNIIGVELQKEVYELAKKSVEINNLQNRIQILNMNIKDLPKYYETDTFDVITCNPPFFKVNSDSKFNKNDIKTVARHEIELNLGDIFSIARKLLKNNGVISIVHRPDRLIEIIETMRKNNIEPKKVRFVYPKIHSDCNIILIEGSKNGNPGLKILPPLYVHDNDGKYLEEIEEMFK
ncbi:MAG: tRNA1(Val) (adenine(37)-N6)-methyltransferase [Bacilli bacterium]|nr:tRNA1(Val) (adenine(37)-N6)-methyltransferase [Bacilli bacterium]